MYRMYGISGGMDAKERMCLFEMGCGRNQTGSIHKYIHVFALRAAKAVKNCCLQDVGKGREQGFGSLPDSFFPPQPPLYNIKYSENSIFQIKPSLLIYKE